MKNLIYLFSAFIALFVCSCTESLDKINTKSSIKGAVENPFFSKVITNGSEQNWQMIRSVNLTVEVNDDYKGDYYSLVTIYDRNPLSKDFVPNVLASGRAKLNENFKAAFSLPSASKMLFVEQKTPTGEKEVLVLSFETGTTELVKNVSFKKKLAPVVKSVNFVTNNPFIRASFEAEFVPTIYTEIPANAIELQTLSENAILASNKNYKITGNCEEFRNYWNATNTFVYVSGVLDLKKAKIADLSSGLTLVIMPGGVVKADKLSLLQAASLSIMSGGKLEVAKEFYPYTELNEVYNLGDMTVGTLKGNFKVIYNGEEATLNAQDISFTTSGHLLNYGKINAKKMTIGATVSLFSSGNIEIVENLRFNHSSSIFLDGGRLMVGGNISFNGNLIELKNKAIIKSAKKITINSSDIEGMSKDNLILAPEIVFTRICSLVGTVSRGLVLASDNFKDLSFFVVVNQNVVFCTIADCTIDSDYEEAGDPANQEPEPIINNTVYSYAFEDNWPKYGDYDMNDAIAYLTQTKKVLNNENKVTSLVLKGKAMAAGASKTIHLFLRLTGIQASAVNEVVGADFDLDKTVVSLGALNELLNIEKGKNANTWPCLEGVEPQGFEVTYTFTNAVDQEKLDIALLDLFIVTSEEVGQGRTEVHLSNFLPTERANRYQRGLANSLSVDKPYLSKSVAEDGTIIEDGLCFALMIPTQFHWSIELQRIDLTYNHFSDWVKGNGEEYTDWYDYLLDDYANSEFVYPVEKLLETD